MERETKTNLQFSICGISCPVCGKHSLDSVDSPRTNNKLVRRRRASCPSEIHGGQVKTVDVHELMYNNFKKKEISVAIIYVPMIIKLKCMKNRKRRSCHMYVLIAIIV